MRLYVMYVKILRYVAASDWYSATDFNKLWRHFWVLSRSYRPKLFNFKKDFYPYNIQMLISNQHVIKADYSI